jgi:hypothetical protein
MTLIVACHQKEGGFAPRLRLPPGYLGTKNEARKEEGRVRGVSALVVWRAGR